MVLVGLTLWFGRQYYVGTGEANHVAIFRGLHGSILGVDLHQRIEDTGLRYADLTSSGRAAVGHGVKAADLGAARAAVERLRSSELLPVCRSTPVRNGSIPVAGRDCRPGP